jgi:signal transduction histidine kinase
MVLNLELLKQSLSTPASERAETPERLGGRVQIVEQELARLGRSLEMLLSQTAPVRMQAERFDLRELLREIESLMGAQARQQQVALHVETPPETVDVVGHRDLLKQAMLNLAINALEAMPDRGALTMSLQTAGETARVSVRDTGPGIPEAIRDRIFEMHVTTKASGTGIGLHVARTVVESDGGSLLLISTGDAGTIFEMALPLAPEGA